MNNRVKAIAINTAKKVYNNPVIFILIVACLALIGSTQMYKALTMGLETQLMVDAALALINLLGIVIAIYLGANSISEEFEARTAHILLSKPVSRKELVMGKFLGTWLASAIMVGILGIGSLIIVAISSGGVQWGILGATVMIIFQVGVVAAFATMFSSFLKPTTATIAATVLFIVLSVLYVYPGFAEGSFRIDAFNLDQTQHEGLKKTAGEDAVVVQSDQLGQSAPGTADYIEEETRAVAAEGEEGENPEEAPAVPPETIPGKKQSYTVTTRSKDKFTEIVNFLDSRNLSHITASGPDQGVYVCSSIIPDLNHLNVKNEVGNNFDVAPGRFFLSLLYGLVLMGMFLCITLFCIEKKEIV